ncbi:MAG: pseudouridine synthase [Clostridia bacterium]|nr:pseudouridine synthase [Clostridia bacterium]
MPKERIDKWIASTTTLSRKEVKALLRQKRVTVNGVTVTDGGFQTDAEQDAVTVDGVPFSIKPHIYIMLNKPTGIVSASHSPKEKTVIDLVPPQLQRNGLFPAGRLDKDTTGFVLITDDGDFAHRILSPKNHIQKTYIAQLERPISPAEIAILKQGVVLRDGTQLLPASVQILGEDMQTVQIRICEGKYHQIKRMLAAVGNRVTALQRTHMGALPLDSALPPGACREITPEELNKICE